MAGGSLTGAWERHEYGTGQGPVGVWEGADDCEGQESGSGKEQLCRGQGWNRSLGVT